MKLLASLFTDVVVIDSVSEGRATPPRLLIKKTRVVVFPVNITNIHWCLICVVFAWPRGHVAFVYDPMEGPERTSVVEKWKAWYEPLIQRWWERGRSEADADTPGMIRWQSVVTPKQRDGHNCGVFVVAMAYAYMAEHYDIQELDFVKPAALALMRLRLLYFIVTRSSSTGDDPAPPWEVILRSKMADWCRDR